MSKLKDKMADAKFEVIGFDPDIAARALVETGNLTTEDIAAIGEKVGRFNNMERVARQKSIFQNKGE